jgi:predicted RNase H-like HicB family nuclease
MKIQNFSVIIEQDKNGFVAECLDLQGCYTQGKSYGEVVKNIREVICLCLCLCLEEKPIYAIA